MKLAFRPRVDVWMLAAVLMLVTIGVVMVGAASPMFAESTAGDPTALLRRQAIFALVGAVACIVGAGISPQRVERWAVRGLIGAFVLLLIVPIPGIGHAAGGARRWVALGPVAIQAGEVAKLAVVAWLARSLARDDGRVLDLRAGVLPRLAIPLGVAVLLLLEPDFGTAVMLLCITFMMLFLGGARVGTLAGLMSLALPAALILVSSSAYRMRRVVAFLDPWAHRSDAGYQITESLMTLGSGGAFGLGFGESRQKLFFLPAAHTDFIFAVLGEELGFVGVALVIGCFLAIGVRAYRAAVRSKHAFTTFFIAGTSAILLVQATFNIAVVLGLVPTKGITLPFVSYGGSSLVMSMFTAGLLLRACADATRGGEAEQAGPSPLSRFASLRSAAAVGAMRSPP